jgi:Carboxypeptidase regulatory-like domain
VLIHAGTNQERHAVTNEAGLYTFPNVPVGTYRIAAALQGFKSISKTGVQVNAGINIRVDVQMEIGALAETVTVEGTSPLTDTSAPVSLLTAHSSCKGLRHVGISS